ncbi:hypothetical protein [Chitinophaga nivalis]|uniref:Tail fiber protein n=1 Tax=Chitinophaga nivalis TaxID=2991709 RepID=A0ABT3IFC3_9BACT|nr:hypothetical protein [Chitinophaga nivalis]MCW3467649.1 hypothetical protein [Chitinophaga nivalis]MCW3482659.1 hypothetical protein [Chitinophaga nivalis]
MAIQQKNLLKNWFKTGDYPTQEQFWDWMDSYLHKTEDKVAIDNVQGLRDTLNQKADYATYTTLFEMFTGLVKNALRNDTVFDGEVAGYYNTLHVKNEAVTGKLLEGLNIPATAENINAADTILQALAKLQKQLYNAVTFNNNGDLDMAGAHILNLPDAQDRKEPLTKGQFDDLFSAVGHNRGGIDCAANPNYPASNLGDRWEVTLAGKIGGVNGIEVDPFDEIICRNTSTGGDQSVAGNDFYIVQGNIGRATETTAGYVRIATYQEVADGTDDNQAVTPAKLTTALQHKADKGTTLAAYGITDAISQSQLGTPNGVASLGPDGRIPDSQLPRETLRTVTARDANTTGPINVNGGLTVSRSIVCESTIQNTCLRLLPTRAAEPNFSCVFDFYDKNDVTNSGYGLFGNTAAAGRWTYVTGILMGSSKNGSGTTKDILISAHDYLTDENVAIFVQANTNRVGIGTNTPTVQLDVAGDAKIAGTLQLGGSTIFAGVGSPEGRVTAPVGSLYTRNDGGPGTTLYVKESGFDNTGWTAK